MTYRKSTGTSRTARRDPDEMQAKIEALQARQAAGIAELVTSDAWQRYLTVQAKFHCYSFGNTLLILAQCPDATRVMPYGRRDKSTGKPLSGWLSVGRQVRAGERGIQIWTPRTRMVDDTDAAGSVRHGADGKPRRREQLYGWGIGYVFDISQTDGDPLPEPVALLAGEDDQGLFDRLAKVAGELGFAVEFADLGATNGCTEFGPDKITINPDRDRVHQCKTMAHELGHAILHRDADYAAERGRCELEAESVAYVVLGALDTPVDTSAYSFGYVAHWQQAGARDAGKVGEAIESSGKAVQKAARQILDLLARTA